MVVGVGIKNLDIWNQKFVESYQIEVGSGGLWVNPLPKPGTDKIAHGLPYSVKL